MVSSMLNQRVSSGSRLDPSIIDSRRNPTGNSRPISWTHRCRVSDKVQSILLTEVLMVGFTVCEGRYL